LWLDKIVDRDFCNLMEKEAEQRVLKNKEKIWKMLTLIKGEAEASATYYVLNDFCDMLGLPTTSVKEVTNALRKEGFQAFLTHFNSGGIKSNVPATNMKKLLQKIVMNQ